MEELNPQLEQELAATETSSDAPTSQPSLVHQNCGGALQEGLAEGGVLVCDKCKVAVAPDAPLDNPPDE